MAVSKRMITRLVRSARDQNCGQFEVSFDLIDFFGSFFDDLMIFWAVFDDFILFRLQRGSRIQDQGRSRRSVCEPWPSWRGWARIAHSSRRENCAEPCQSCVMSPSELCSIVWITTVDSPPAVLQRSPFSPMPWKRSASASQKTTSTGLRIAGLESSSPMNPPSGQSVRADVKWLVFLVVFTNLCFWLGRIWVVLDQKMIS